jgi:hypothetical protein
MGDHDMRVTRSRAHQQKKPKPIPIINIEKPPNGKTIEGSHFPKRKIVSLNQSTIIKKAKLSIQKTKPSYYKRPTYTVPRNGTFEYLDNCEAIIKSNLIKIKPELKQQIEELQKFSIFKDMNSIDIKTVQYLRNQMGELNEKDQELEKLLKSESSTEEPSCNFYEFYGIEYDEGEESI